MSSDLTATDKIHYMPLPMVLIEDNIVKIYIFNTEDNPKLIFTGPFDKKNLNVVELQNIMVKIWKDGIQKKIDEFK